MRYDSDLLYRPPGEWRSYLLQCTIGCSHNKCTFCAMYKEKKFRVRPVEEILEDIDMARSYYGPNVERVFLMDGDAIVMRTEQLLQILEKLYAAFPKLQKVTTYAGPRSTLSKTPEELRALREAGLTRAYLGVESGSDAVLQAIQKGCTAAEMLQAGQNLVAAGIDTCSAALEETLLGAGVSQVLVSLICEGIIAGVGGVLSFLPQIALLFFFLSFLEDIGYMSRAAFIMDRLLRRFGELAFLPAACTRTNETPVYLSDLGGRAEISAAILALQVKRLISVDFALPLQGFDYAGYEDYPVRGSMALTAAGQEALDSLNIQGCGE